MKVKKVNDGKIWGKGKVVENFINIINVGSETYEEDIPAVPKIPPSPIITKNFNPYNIKTVGRFSIVKRK